MGIGKKVGTEVREWASLGILVVVVSLILLKFKLANPGDITCSTGYTFNATANNCMLDTNNSVTTAINGVGSTVDTFVSAFSEPKNWAAIVIIAMIGFAVMKIAEQKKKNR